MIIALLFLILFALLFPKALKFLLALMFIGGIMVLGEVHAADFLVARECTIAVKTKAPIHTKCIINGGEQGGIIDVSIRTPDGRVYSLDGPIDGEGGHEFLLQNHRADQTATTPAGYPGSWTSFAGSCCFVTNIAFSAAPFITGIAKVGQVLTASPGSWANGPISSYAYQWKSGAGNATGGGANTANYTAVTADIGNVLTVVVNATNGAGTSTTPATSAATAIVTAAGSVPVNTHVPTIAGTAQVGHVLTESGDTWTNSPTTFTWQWNRGGAPIALNGTASTYAPVTGDIGSTLTVTMTASNVSGSSAPSTSAATAAVTAASGGMLTNTQLLSVGVNSPYGSSGDGINWNANGFTSWTAAMPRSLRQGIIAAGFNTIRLYVDPTPLFLAADDATINARLTAGPLVAVADMTSGGINVILDYQILESSSPPGWSTTDMIDGPGGPKFTRMVHCAVVTAQALIPYGNQVAFELFNEPPTPSGTFTDAAWLTMVNSYYDSVRAAAPSLALVVTCTQQGDTSKIISFDPSHFDTNTFISFHDYNPTPIAYQDIPIGGGFKYINRLAFPPGAEGQTEAGQIANALNLAHAAGDNSDDASITGLLQFYFRTPEDAAWIKTRFTRVATWADSHSIARKRVFHGEFGGCGDPSVDNPRSGLGGDIATRNNYYSAVATADNALGFSRSVHSLEADYFEITDGNQTLIQSFITALALTVPPSQPTE